jgi:hydroxypyruvate isomerase
VQSESGADNLRLLFDIYHLATNGDDVDAALASYADRIGHVQIADSPGRHEPGSGTLDIARYLDELSSRGYAGHVGLEYAPTGASVDSFGWLPREARGRRP